MGVRSVHGVPGDYNLVALDYIDKTGLKWVGSVNELNAGKHFHLPHPFKTVTAAYDPHLAYSVAARTRREPH